MFLVYLSTFVIFTAIAYGFKNGDWLTVIPVIIVWLGVGVYARSSKKVVDLFNKVTGGKDE